MVCYIDKWLAETAPKWLAEEVVKLAQPLLEYLGKQERKHGKKENSTYGDNNDDDDKNYEDDDECRKQQA